MGLLDRLLGRRSARPRYDGYAEAPIPPRSHRPWGEDDTGAPRSADERAVERYRYLLRTAAPDQVEAAHAEAFGKLTPEQRRMVLEQLAATGERPAGDDPRSLARAATRAEIRQPGVLERALGGRGGGYGGGYGPGQGPGYGGTGMGSMIGGSLLGTVAGVVVGTAVADALFDTGLGDGGLFGGGDEEAYAEGFEDGAGQDSGDPAGGFADGAGYDGGDPGGDPGGDFGEGDPGGGS